MKREGAVWLNKVVFSIYPLLIYLFIRNKSGMSHGKVDPEIPAGR